LSVGAQIGLALGTAFGTAILSVIATWWKPNQIGRFISCGRWPRKGVSPENARTEMEKLIVSPFLIGSRPMSQTTGVDGDAENQHENPEPAVQEYSREEK
jgi:hypothetical protein